MRGGAFGSWLAGWLAAWVAGWDKFFAKSGRRFPKHSAYQIPLRNKGTSENVRGSAFGSWLAGFRAAMCDRGALNQGLRLRCVLGVC